MASISSRRIANNITWSLAFTTRARTLAFSFSSTEHARRQRQRSHQHHHRYDAHTRHFSTQPYMHQTAQPGAATAAPTTPKPPPPSAPKSAPSSIVPKPFTPRDQPPTTMRNEIAKPTQEPIRELTTGLSDVPAIGENDGEKIDWTRSFHGLAVEPFSREAQEILMQPIPIADIEIKAEGLIYLPEIKYRRILNRAFGPGGWGLAPRGETIVTTKCVTREYALVVGGRLVSVARGEQDYYDRDGIPTATEGCKSNALMRCCKDLGVASELWDPRFIKDYFKQHVKEVWVEHVVNKKRKKMPLRKDDEVRYPFKEVGPA